MAHKHVFSQRHSFSKRRRWPIIFLAFLIFICDFSLRCMSILQSKSLVCNDRKNNNSNGYNRNVLLCARSQSSLGNPNTLLSLRPHLGCEQQLQVHCGPESQLGINSIYSFSLLTAGRVIFAAAAPLRPENYEIGSHPPTDFELDMNSRSDYRWSFRDLFLVGRGITIRIPRVVMYPGPLSYEVCLRNVTIEFSNVTIGGAITIISDACVEDSHFIFTNVRSAPIPRWRIYPESDVNDNTHLDVEDENDFRLSFHFSGSRFLDSEVNFKGIVGPTVARRVGEDSGKLTPVDVAIPPDGSISNGVGGRMRIFFRRPYIRDDPLVAVYFGINESSSPVSSGEGPPPDPIVLSGATVRIHNVLQVQYGPWRYIRPQLVEVALCRAVMSTGPINVDIQQIQSISQFLFEAPVHDPNMNLPQPWQANWQQAETGEEHLPTTSDHDAVNLFANSFTLAARRRVGYGGAKSSGFPSPVGRTGRRFDIPSSSVVALLFPKDIENLEASNVSVENVHVVWHKSLVMSIINIFNHNLSPVAGNVQNDAFSATFALVRLDFASSVEGKSSNPQDKIKMVDNRFSIRNVTMALASFLSLIESARDTNWLFPPSELFDGPDSVAMDTGIVPSVNSITTRTTVNIKYFENIMHSFVFVNATAAKVVGVEIGMAGSGWGTGGNYYNISAIRLRSDILEYPTVPDLLRFRTPLATAKSDAARRISGAAAYEWLVNDELTSIGKHNSAALNAQTTFFGGDPLIGHASSVPLAGVIMTLQRGFQFDADLVSISDVMCGVMWSCSGVIIGLYTDVVDGIEVINVAGTEMLMETRDLPWPDSVPPEPQFPYPQHNLGDGGSAGAPVRINSATFYIRNIVVLGGLRKCRGVAILVNHQSKISDSLFRIENVTVLKGSLTNYAADDVAVLVASVGTTAISKSRFFIGDAFTNNTAVPVVISLTYNATISFTTFDIHCEKSRCTNRAGSFDEMFEADELRAAKAHPNVMTPISYRSLALYNATYRYGPKNDVEMGNWDKAFDTYFSGPIEAEASTELSALTKIASYVHLLIGCQLGGAFFQRRPSFQSVSTVTFVDNFLTIRDIALHGGPSSTLLTVRTGCGTPSLDDLLRNLIPSNPGVLHPSSFDGTSVASYAQRNTFTLEHLRVVAPMRGSTADFGEAQAFRTAGSGGGGSVEANPPPGHGIVGVQLTENTIYVHDVDVLPESQSFKVVKFYVGSSDNIGSIEGNAFHVWNIRGFAGEQSPVVNFEISSASYSVRSNSVNVSRVRTWGNGTGGGWLWAKAKTNVEVWHTRLALIDCRHINLLSDSQNFVTASPPTSHSFTGLQVDFSGRSHRNFTSHVFDCHISIGHTVPKWLGALAGTFRVAWYRTALGEDLVGTYKIMRQSDFFHRNVSVTGPLWIKNTYPVIPLGATSTTHPKLNFISVAYNFEKPETASAIFYVEHSTFTHHDIFSDLAYGGTAVSVSVSAGGTLDNCNFVFRRIHTTSVAAFDSDYKVEGGVLSPSIPSVGLSIDTADGASIMSTRFQISEITSRRFMNGFLFPNLSPEPFVGNEPQIAGAGSGAGFGIAVRIQIGKNSDCTSADQCTFAVSNVHSTLFNISDVSADGYGVHISVNGRSSIFESTFTIANVYQNHTNAVNPVRLIARNACTLVSTTINISRITIVNAFHKKDPNANSAVVIIFGHESSVIRSRLEISHVLHFSDPMVIQTSAALQQPFPVAAVPSVFYHFRSAGAISGDSSVIFSRLLNALGVTTLRKVWGYPCILISITASSSVSESNIIIHSVNSSTYRPPKFTYLTTGVFLSVMGTIAAGEAVATARFKLNNVDIRNIVADGMTARLLVNTAGVTSSKINISNVYSTAGAAKDQFSAQFAHLHTVQLVITGVKTQFSGNRVSVVNAHGTLQRGFLGISNIIGLAEPDGSLYFDTVSRDNGNIADDRVGGSETVFVTITDSAKEFDVTDNIFTLSQISALSPLSNSPAVFLNFSGYGDCNGNKITITNVANMQPDPVRSNPPSFTRFNLYPSSFASPIKDYGPKATSPAVLIYIVPPRNTQTVRGNAPTLNFKSNTISISNVTAIQFFEPTLPLGNHFTVAEWVSERRSQLAVRFLQIPLRTPNGTREPPAAVDHAYTLVEDSEIRLEGIYGGIDIELTRSRSTSVNINGAFDPLFYIPENVRPPPLQESFGIGALVDGCGLAMTTHVTRCVFEHVVSRTSPMASVPEVSDRQWPVLHPSAFLDPFRDLRSSTERSPTRSSRMVNSKIYTRALAHRAPIHVASVFRETTSVLFNIFVNSTVTIRRSTLHFGLSRMDGNPKFVVAAGGAILLSLSRVLGSLFVGVGFASTGIFTMQRVEVVSDDGEEVMGPFSSTDERFMETTTPVLNYPLVDQFTRKGVRHRFDDVLRYIIAASSVWEAPATHTFIGPASGETPLITIVDVMNKTTLGRNAVFLNCSVSLGASIVLKQITAPRLCALIDAHQCLAPIAERRSPSKPTGTSFQICSIQVQSAYIDHTLMFTDLQHKQRSPLSSVDEIVAVNSGESLSNRAPSFYLPTLSISGAFGEGTSLQIADSKIIGHRLPFPDEVEESVARGLVAGGNSVPPPVMAITRADVRIHDSLFRSQISESNLDPLNGGAPPSVVVLSLNRPPTFVTPDMTPYTNNGYTVLEDKYSTAAFPTHPALTGFAAAVAGTTIGVEGQGWAVGEAIQSALPSNVANGGRSECTIYGDYAYVDNPAGSRSGPCFPDASRAPATAVSAFSLSDSAQTPLGLKSLELWGNYMDPVSCRGGIQLRLHFLDEVFTDDAFVPVSSMLPRNASLITCVQNVMGLVNITSPRKSIRDFNSFTQQEFANLFSKSLARRSQQDAGSSRASALVRRWACNIVVLRARRVLGPSGEAIIPSPIAPNGGGPIDTNHIVIFNTSLARAFGQYDGGLIPCGLTVSPMPPSRLSPLPRLNISYGLFALHPPTPRKPKVDGETGDPVLPLLTSMLNGNQTDEMIRLLGASHSETYLAALSSALSPFRILRCHETIGGSAAFTEDKDLAAYSASPDGMKLFGLFSHKIESILRGATISPLAQRTNIGRTPFSGAVNLYTAVTPIGAAHAHLSPEARISGPSRDAYPSTPTDLCEGIPSMPRPWRPVTFTHVITEVEHSNSLNISSSRTEAASQSNTSRLRSTVSISNNEKKALTATPPNEWITPTLSVGTPRTKSEDVETYLTDTRTISLTLKPNPTLKPIPAIVSTANTATAITGGVVSVVAVAGGLTSAGQLGVANALARMASCVEPGNGDDDDDDSLPILVHPLQFSLYTTSIGDGMRGHYAASVIGNTIIIPALIAAVSLGPVQLVIRAVKKRNGRSLTRDEALAEMGWPSTLVMPFATLAEGIGAGIVRSFRGGGAYTGSQDAVSVTAGFIGLMVLLAFTGAWVLVLIRVIPRNKAQLADDEANVTIANLDSLSDISNDSDIGIPLIAAPSDGTEDAHPLDGTKVTTSGHRRVAQPFMARLRHLSALHYLRPVWRWVPRSAGDLRIAAIARAKKQLPRSQSEGGDVTIRLRRSELSPLTEDDMERYNNVLGDKRWYYAEIGSFVCSLLVGAMEGSPERFCKSRSIVAFLAAVAQCVFSLTTVVPVELGLQALLALCVVPLSVAVTAKVFTNEDEGGANADTEGLADQAIAVFSVLGNIVGLGLMLLGLVRGAWEMFTSYRTALRKRIMGPSTPILAPSVHGPAPPIPLVDDPQITPPLFDDPFDFEATTWGTPHPAPPAIGSQLHSEDSGDIELEDFCADEGRNATREYEPPPIPDKKTNNPRIGKDGGNPSVLNPNPQTVEDTGIVVPPQRRGLTRDPRFEIGIGHGSLPSSFDNFRGPRWQAELLHRVELAEKAMQPNASSPSSAL